MKTKGKLSDLAGSWNMSDAEAKEMAKKLPAGMEELQRRLKHLTFLKSHPQKVYKPLKKQ